MRTRKLPDARAGEILDCAACLSRAVGFEKITRERVASVAGVSPALVSKYFDTMKALRWAVIEYAVKIEDAPLVAQGLVARHPVASEAPPLLKAQAATHIANL